MPRPATLRIRMAPLALAFGANTLIVAWLALERPGAQRRTVAPSMILIEPMTDDPHIPARAEPVSSKVATRGMKPPVQMPGPVIIAPVAVEESTALITPDEPAPPPIDWKSALNEAVRDHLANEAAAPQGSILDSKPQVMALPKEKERPHKLGDSETHGGSTIVWVDERCYLESEILDRHSMPRMVCKNRSMADRRSEDRADAIEQAVKQKRGGGSARP